MDAPLLLGAFLAGLAGSPHCVLMCGPFASACARTAAGLGAWHAGRLTGYALLGAAAGAAGAVLPGPAWLPGLLAALFLLWVGAALAGLVPEPRVVLPGLAGAGRLLHEGRGALARYAFGVVNGFLPCGLVYTALSIPVALAAPLPGAVAMVAFGAGTLPVLSVAAIGLRRFTPAGLPARRVLAAIVVAIGVWSSNTHVLLTGSARPSAGHHHPRDGPASRYMNGI
jgi:sulfite exporter TauE/SafE